MSKGQTLQDPFLNSLRKNVSQFLFSLLTVLNYKVILNLLTNMLFY